MRIARDLAILTSAMALATWVAGWWCVPIIAAIAALWNRRPRASIVLSAAAAALAWALLLLLQGVFGSSVALLGRDLAVSLGVPNAAPLVLTLVLPMLLAGTAAGTVVALKRMRRTPAA